MNGTGVKRSILPFFIGLFMLLSLSGPSCADSPIVVGQYQNNPLTFTNEEGAGGPAFPEWLKWPLGAVGGLLLLLMGGYLILRSQVKIRTRELQNEIAEHKRTEAALRESQEYLRTILNSIGDAVIATDTVGHITGMNPVAESLTGWPDDQALGKPLSSILRIINTRTREPVEDPVEEVLKGGKTTELARHAMVIVKSKAEFQIADSAAPIRDPDGTVTGVVLVFRDVTDKQRTEQERLRLDKLESVGVLAGGIAHDFNNMLTGLFGNIEIAREFLPADHKSYRFLEAAGQSMERATNLTKQLLTFAKGGDPIREPLLIGAVITETAQFSLRDSNARLQTNIAPDLWPVEADKGQLSQVISNLVINARQAMRSGGTVTIDAENCEDSEGRCVQIAVRDDGTGIDSQYLDKVFDPYFTTKRQGSGLGLTSAHSIISKHNGTITVDSHPDQGTVVTIRLPASEAMPAGTTTVKDPVQRPSHARVLVLDDEEAVRGVIGAMLGSIGYSVTSVVDGEEAIREYRTADQEGVPYDIVIADLTIPGGMGGQAAAREILASNPRAKIIAASGYSTGPTMAKYKEHGFRARIAKPFRAAELQGMILRVLES